MAALAHLLVLVSTAEEGYGGSHFYLKYAFIFLVGTFCVIFVVVLEHLYI